MPSVQDLILAKPASGIQNVKLLLPSDLSHEQLKGLDSLAEEELKLRCGQAIDMFSQLQRAVKAIDVATQGRMEARGQDQNTRAMARLKKFYDHRLAKIREYNSIHQKLVALGEPEGNFPLLTLQDNHWKSMMVGQRTGDLRRGDGALWFHGGERRSKGQDVAKDAVVALPLVGTQMCRRKGESELCLYVQTFMINPQRKSATVLWSQRKMKFEVVRMFTGV